MMKKSKIKLSKSSFIGPLIAALLVAVAIGFTTDRFWDLNNWNNLTLSVSITALVAIGSTLVILIGGIDISPGSMIAMLTMILATIVKFEGIPLWAGVLLVIVFGAVLGALNGALTAYLAIPAFISTLATSSIYKGIAFLFNNGSPIFSVADNL
jgi:ribose transport system permease protein